MKLPPMRLIALSSGLGIITDEGGNSITEALPYDMAREILRRILAFKESDQ
ncbi:hypothetical protein Q3Y58_03055 [Pseudovibrio sp. SPO723]|nr:hypothetical protein [Pseudovibrio sp. SPO723]